LTLPVSGQKKTRLSGRVCSGLKQASGLGLRFGLGLVVFKIRDYQRQASLFFIDDTADRTVNPVCNAYQFQRYHSVCGIG
jgi:hypothetical protein